MIKYLKQLFMFLAPIFKTAAIQVAADELTKKAYPTRRPGAQRPRPYMDQAEPTYRDVQTGKFKPESRYHDVVLVAFDITGPNALLVQSVLESLMPETGDHEEGINIDAWWIADDVVGNSDCDSAVFVPQGRQKEARNLLRDRGLLGN